MSFFKARDCESCTKRLDVLQSRLERLEEKLSEDRLEILNVVEKVTNALAARTRRRTPEPEPETKGQALARARRMYAVPQG